MTHSPIKIENMTDMHVRPGDEDGEYREGGGDGVELEPLVHRLLPHQWAGGEVRHHVNLQMRVHPQESESPKDYL